MREETGKLEPELAHPWPVAWQYRQRDFRDQRWSNWHECTEHNVREWKDTGLEFRCLYAGKAFAAAVNDDGMTEALENLDHAMRGAMDWK